VRKVVKYNILTRPNALLVASTSLSVPSTRSLVQDIIAAVY